jgi:beta-N-acetylhexosaminidase
VDEVTSIKRTLGFFADKYREDPLFAERVDAAVMRVLNLKLKLYGGIFSPSRVRPTAGLEGIGVSRNVTYDVASRSATLVFPAADELSDRLGDPPQFGERVVFFTDERRVQWCSDCDPEPIVDVEDMEGAVQQLYGIQGARQIGVWTLTSFSTADLAFFLREEVPEGYRGLFTPPEIFEPAVEGADWLVFVTLGQSDEVYGSNALRLMLDRRPDLAQTKKVVVFAMDVPYDVDATDISKVDAYYALYAKSGPFIDVAARLLFQELPAMGAPPVSVPAIDYALIEVLAPDPEQVIELDIVADVVEGEPQATPGGFGVGDVIHVRTGIIIDQNGHPVPDGTIVHFTTIYQGDPSTAMSFETTTAGGVARADIALDRLGPLTIMAESDPARRSESLQLNVQEGVRAFVTVMAPTAMPTEVPPPVATMPQPTPTTTAEPAAESSAQQETPPPDQGLGGLDLILGMLGMGLVAMLGLYVRRRWQGQIRMSEVRVILAAMVSGLLIYNYLALGLPGSGGLHAAFGSLAPMLATVVGSSIGLVSAFLAQRALRSRGFNAD